jgi:DNA topoisomerase-3
MRTRRPFKAFLTWDAEAGKVNFEFEPRTSKFPPRKAPAGNAAREPAAKYSPTAKAAKTVAGKAAAKKAPAKKAPAAKAAPAKKAAAPRKTGAGLKPSPQLAAVIGAEPVARTEVIKRLWDYIKAKGLQDAKDRRAINADDKLLPVFGKPQVTMFELAGIVGKHLSSV